ncbi:MAG: hypothetical protein EBZ48_16370, partial [Proteobacteria bacterium]|nr:hypothetical protein [Pseudomonadota bacterium]
MPSLCIDFGTSSIRASYQSDKGRVAVLPLGQQAGERELDGASIMSEIAVDLRAQCIFFGEAGYAASIKSSGDVQRIPSAKLWLASPSELDLTAIPQSNLTRRALLTGLIGFAVATIRGLSAAHRMPADFKGVDVRIAHPIWDESVREHANRELRRIASASMELVKFGFTNPMPFSELRRFEDKYREAQTVSEVDVLEPIAAALQLVPYEANT